jgi:hypothetical protein
VSVRCHERASEPRTKAHSLCPAGRKGALMHIKR